MDGAEVAPGLWRWVALHPAWTEADAEDWGQAVGSVYCEIENGIALIDPLVPADRDELERFWRALDRDVERFGAPRVFVTCSDHERSAPEILARYPGATRSADGRPGVEPVQTARVGEIVYWLPAYAALVAGDVLLGDGVGGIRVCPDGWLDGADRAAVRASLRPLLELPVERVLPSHGRPVLAGGLAALERALGE